VTELDWKRNRPRGQNKQYHLQQSTEGEKGEKGREKKRKGQKMVVGQGEEKKCEVFWLLPPHSLARISGEHRSRKVRPKEKEVLRHALIGGGGCC